MSKPLFMNSWRTSSGKSRQTGFTIVELMIASTLSLLILAGLVSVFVNSNRSRNEIERASQQIENGRYAMQVISSDLRNAGYLAEFDPRVLSTPTAKPDACATPTADLRTALPLHIQGYDNGSSVPTCLSDVRGNTDILVVRRASTCVAGTTNCDAVSSGNTYFQASLCNSASELASLSSSDFYALDTVVANLNRHKKDCASLANIYRYRTHIYFVANNDNPADGIPTLKRAELGVGGFTIVPLVEGIENIQVEYGIDTNNDGAPEVFTADPDTYNACVGVACVQNWRNVVSVKINVLARNTEKTSGYTNNKTYTLGLTAAGADNNVVINGDSFKRHVYRSNVRLNNPAGRSSTP